MKLLSLPEVPAFAPFGRKQRINLYIALPFGVHARMLRHACGYALANAGHDTRLIQNWLSHRAIQHTRATRN